MDNTLKITRMLEAASIVAALAGALLLVAVAAAFAQNSRVQPDAFGNGYTIITPGQPVTRFQPDAFGSGGTFITPGMPSTRYQPDAFGNGGTLIRPTAPLDLSDF